MPENQKDIILVVDDNPDDLRVLSRYLHQAGFEVETASNVFEGIDIAAGKEIKCIILDYQMPGMSGLDMLKKIKMDPKLKYIPVIMLTGLEQEEHILEGLGAGANDYLGKSSSYEIIMARIKAALRVKKMQDELKEMNDRLQNVISQLEEANIAKTKALGELDKAMAELKEISIRDSLTKLYNHGYFRDMLDNEFSRAKRYKQNICCLMIDIDFFKKINDTYGHLFGDKVLIEMANCMTKCLRNVDILARYGGEEFAVLLNDSNYESALIVAEKLKKFIEEYRFEGEKFSIKLTISIGISSLFEDGVLEKDKFLGFADFALYVAKMRGRNIVVMYKDIAGTSYIEDMKEKELENKIFGINEVSKQSYIEAIKTLITTLEQKDPYTREHSINVLRYSSMIAVEMGLPMNEITIIENSAILHDLGKIGISDNILFKKGKLTDEEYTIVKRHPVIAVNILQSCRYIRREIDIILHHHERYDGKGYPAGLRGKNIPLGSRIIAVADTYDAMRAARPYRDMIPMENIVNELIENTGTQFDPLIVFAFFNSLFKKKLIPTIADVREILEKIKQKTDTI